VSFDRFVRRPEELYGDEAWLEKVRSQMQSWRPLFETRPFFDAENYSLATFMTAYVVFVKQWAASVTTDRLLVLSFRDLCEKTASTMNTVFDFLEIPRVKISDASAANRSADTGESIPTQTAEYVKSACRPYNEELYEYLGRDLGWQ
jgi:hypothetical protein